MFFQPGEHRVRLPCRSYHIERGRKRSFLQGQSAGGIRRCVPTGFCGSSFLLRFCLTAGFFPCDSLLLIFLCSSLQQRFCESLQRLSPEVAECRNRCEGPAVRVHLKALKGKGRASRPAKLRPDLFLRQGAASRFLHGTSLRRTGNAATGNRHPGRLPRAQTRFAADRKLPVFPEILLPDPVQKLLTGPAVTGLVDGHHVPAVPFPVIAGAEIRADVQAVQRIQVLPVHRPDAGASLFVPLIEAVQVFSVNGDGSRHVFRFLHAALDLEGIDAAVDEIRKDLHGAHVLHRNRIADAVPSGRPSVLIQHLIGKAAGSGAAPAVAAPSAEKARHQAPPGIGIAHRSVDEALHFDVLLFEKADLPE